MKQFLTTLIVSVIFMGVLTACDIDAQQRLPVMVADPPTATPTPVPPRSRVALAAPTDTPAATPTPAATATLMPTPTATPVPSTRLQQAQYAWDTGNYDAARQEFDALLQSPGADPDERRLALYWRGRSELMLEQLDAAIVSLSEFVTTYPDDALARPAQFNLGRAYESAGQVEAAQTAYQQSIIPDDPANVYIYQRSGDMLRQAGQTAAAITAYEAAIDSTLDNSLTVALRESIALAELAADNPAGAVAQYEAILRIARIESYRAKILRLLGAAHLANGDPESAYESYLEAVNRYPSAEDSYLALVELVNAGVEVDDFQRGLVDYYAKAYEPGILALEAYLASDPDTPDTSPDAATTPLAYRAEALWLLGLSYQAINGPSRAIEYYQLLINDYPNDPNWGLAHIYIGTARVDLNQISAAKSVFRTFAAAYPNHELAGEALWRAGRLELDGDLFAEAHTSLLAMAEEYPDDEYADDALFWAGRAAHQQDDYEGAVTAWGRLAQWYPDSEYTSNGSYWLAKSLLELGRKSEAEAILEDLTQLSLDYYALRARDLLTGEEPHSVPLVIPDAAQHASEQSEAEAWLSEWTGLPVTAQPKPDLQQDPAFQRGQALLTLGLRAEALAEFETVKDTWWDDPIAMYQLALYFREHNMGRLSIISAARVIYSSPELRFEDTPIFMQRQLYPIYFGELIFNEAQQYELDPALVLALMRQESLFEYSAVSIAGARGLMQVMPTTGDYIAEQTALADFDRAQLWLPYRSVEFGTWYLNQQLAIFEGNQFAALAAYNAGPGRVLEWIENWEDLDTFVETIPFWESRLYVRKIYINLDAYREIYGAQQ